MIGPEISYGLGGPVQGVPREDGFDITVASELMAILCLSKSLHDLKARINRIVIGYTTDRNPITVQDLQVGGAIATLLKDAIKPNLVQTLAHTPAIVHGGPFANIAHGCNSVLATRTAMSLADYTVTEAGFGADLGAEKFLDIKVPVLGKHPDTIVIVATVKALKLNGGQALQELDTENLSALKKGVVNLTHHIKSMAQYGVPVVVAINRYTQDTDREINYVKEVCDDFGVQALDTDVWAKGGDGALDLAQTVVETVEKPATFKPLYSADTDLTEKIQTIVTKIYGGKHVEYSKKALNQMKRFKQNGWDKLPVCMAKTQYSFSDDPKVR